MENKIILKLGDYIIIKDDGNKIYIRDKKNKIDRKLIKLEK